MRSSHPATEIAIFRIPNLITESIVKITFELANIRNWNLDDFVRFFRLLLFLFFLDLLFYFLLNFNNNTRWLFLYFW